MLRFGIIGCGTIHSTHTDAIAKIDGAQLSAVYDIDPAKAEAVSEKLGVPAVESVEALYDHADVISILTPSGLHAEMGMAAARAGKHVVCEKPIDVTLEPAKALVKTCREAGVKLTVISQHRFADDIRAVQKAAQSGGLGRLVMGDATIKWYRTQAYYDSGEWRGTVKLDGGCLMNQGVHYVDMIQWVMGGVKSVQAQIRTMTHDIEVEDNATALIEYKNGAIGVIQASTSVYPGMGERIEVHGQYGTVVVEGDRTKIWKVDEEGAQKGLYGAGVMKQPTPNVHVMGEAEGATGAADPTAIWGEQHRLQIEDFVQAVRDDRDPFMTGEMALEPLKVILAIYESSAKGGARVELPQ